ncbi:hypothetical protein ZWY2020_014520 [Hordeum vulgare]|nr:hypothetical protein ZWY2020_014520 [Hordeum vulgare]
MLRRIKRLYKSCDTTNQRVQFDIEPCGKHLATGGQDGMVHIYDLQGGQWVTGFQAAADTVNGFTFHPYLPLATTSSGHRRFGKAAGAATGEPAELEGNTSASDLPGENVKHTEAMETEAINDSTDANYSELTEDVQSNVALTDEAALLELQLLFCSYNSIRTVTAYGMNSTMSHFLDVS